MALANPDDRLLANEAGTEAIGIIERLRERGFVAYLAGGCVRDALLGRVPKDYDVATDATPDAVRDCFGRHRTLAFGAAFGVIGVLPQQRERTLPVAPIEVATFRSDGEYSDGRRPDQVHFGTAEQDALRRDFTINGLFYDPLERRVIDFVGGQSDLSRGLLRTIGSASDRFAEDKLRMLRAVRFVTTLEMSLEATTFAAIAEHAGEIDVVSGERIGAEMRRILITRSAPTGLELLHRTGLDRLVLPEWIQVDRTLASELMLAMHHISRESNPFSTSLVLLLLSHPAPAVALRAIVERWRLANHEQADAAFGLAHWQDFLNADTMRWSQLQPLLIDSHRDTALDVAASYAHQQGYSTLGIERCRVAISWPPEKLDPPPLLTGNDLQRLGIAPGPIYRTILQRVRDAQLDETIATPEQAIAIAEAAQ